MEADKPDMLLIGVQAEATNLMLQLNFSSNTALLDACCHFTGHFSFGGAIQNLSIREKRCASGHFFQLYFFFFNLSGLISWCLEGNLNPILCSVSVLKRLK